jgi:glycosyltransferase involved in cell wall biosynthesis
VRIGLNLTQFVPGKSGGVQTYAESLARGLLDLQDGHRYVLFVNADTESLFEDLRARCELVHVDVHIPRRARLLERVARGAVFRAYARGLDALLRAARLDVLHFPLSFMVPLRYPGATVVTFHDLQQEYLPEFFSADELRWRARHYLPSAHRATCLIAISRHTAASLVTRYRVPPDRITVVHNAIDERLLAPAEPVALELPDRFFVYPAAFWPHKNHARLLRAVLRLRAARGFDLPLVLTGMDAADAGPVRSDIARLGLAGQVRVLGYVPRSQLREILRRAEFMIFPSLFEGFGLPVVEAMAMGCPVACSRATSLPELVGEDGLLFDPERVEDIAAAILALWRDPQLRLRTAAAQAPRARRFTVRRMAEETAAVHARAAQLARARRGAAEWAAVAPG